MKAKKFAARGVALMAAAIFLFNTIPTQAQYYSGRKSAETAGVLSFFGTAVPVITGVWLDSKPKVSDDVAYSVIIGGILVGPSSGYFYAGMPKRGLIGVGIRTALLAGTLALASREERIKAHGDVAYRDEGTTTILLIGSAAVAVTTLADIMLVQEYVNKRNRSLREANWMVTPAYFAGHDAGGLQLQVAF